MNWKILFFVSTAFWLSALLLTQCTQQVDSSASDGELSALAVEGIFKPVLCGDNPSPECYKIQQQMRAYEDAIDSLSKIVPDWEPIHTDQPTIPELIQEMYTLKGYRYKIKELEKLLYQARNRGKDEYIYLMFAVNDDPTSIAHRKSLDSPIRFLDAYFQVETNEGLTTYKPSNEGVVLNKAYTDFPSPCPTACPPPDTSGTPLFR